MRMRRKKWARPELEACDFFLKEPTSNKNKWNKSFNNSAPIHLELGCGRIDDVIGEADEIEAIYINFCNPWPKPRHRKKRLTHTRQLEKYKMFLKQGGDIYFKTDDDALFEDSLKYFEEAGFNIIFKTYDLHKECQGNNIVTEHEEMFSKQGIKIKAAIAQL